mgnify:CR=1 FL=1
MSRAIDLEVRIEEALKEWNWKCSVDEGKLMLLELTVKRQNRSYNSHTEEGFLNSMKVMNKSNTPNKLGKWFMMHMLYECSNQRPLAYYLMGNHRK